MSYYGNDPRNRLYTPIRAVATRQGQTAFTLNYTPGITLFFKNGNMLDPAGDFTASDGSTLTLTRGCNVGDVINGISLAQLNTVKTTFTPTEISATPGQTSFPIVGGYTPGLIKVYLNGLNLESADFTATDGANVVLTVPASSGDVFRAEAFGTFNAANAVQKSGDVMAGALQLTGGSTVPTPALTDSSSALANTAFVKNVTRTKIETLTASVNTNALSVTLASTSLDFRSANQADGSVNAYVQVPQLSITVPSGATLGTVSGQTARLVFLVVYNSGTPVLCVTNLAGGLNLDETGLINTTIISSGATSNNVIYSASGVTANSPYRVVGFVDVSEVTAGTWAAAPAIVQGIGGQALAAMSSLGFGQTWQDVTASRTPGTTYYNTTGRPIMLAGYGVTAGSAISLSVNGMQIAQLNTDASTNATPTVIVPPGESYSYGLSGTVKLHELR
jgi:hypothetical protein